MNPLALARITFGCTCKVQRKLFRFALNGRRAVRAFEKRLENGKPFFPAFLMLSITNRCNLKCEGCWVEQTRPVQELSLEQIHGIINTSEKYDSRFFGILGGEPLLHPEIFRIFECHPQTYFQLFTNGTLLTEKCCARLADLGNVTPLISIEGLETESTIRRGGSDTFSRSVSSLEAAAKTGLFCGVAASINRRNFDELVSEDYLNFVIGKGAHYIWYYIYRPCGSNPKPENALDREQISRLRRFIVEQRTKAKILIVDAYWDEFGRAVCPGAMGLAHHIAPNGAVEFCPVIQFTGEYLNEQATNLEHIFQQNDFLRKMRSFSIDAGRSCVYMESPGELAEFMKKTGALDSSNREALEELTGNEPLPGHGSAGMDIPEKSWLYRLGKKYYFFGFGAYG